MSLQNASKESSDEFTTFGRIFISERLRTSKMRGHRFCPPRGRDTYPLPQSVTSYHQYVSNTSPNLVWSSMHRASFKISNFLTY